jgi:hypothetical protein
VLLTAFAVYCQENQVVFNSGGDYKNGIGSGSAASSSREVNRIKEAARKQAKLKNHERHQAEEKKRARQRKLVENDKKAALAARKLAKQERKQARIQADAERLRQQALVNERLMLQVVAENERSRQQSTQSARSSMINHRGNNYDFLLRYSEGFPKSMANVSCLAISDGGFVAVFDDGDCCYHGIDDEVAKVLDRQRLSNINYLAIGRFGQYFIQKMNGRMFYSGCESFTSAVDQSSEDVSLVSFGDRDTFYIKYDDGSSEWDGNIPKDVQKELRTADVIDCLWLGSSGQYYLGYDSTWMYSAFQQNISKDLVRIIEKKRVKQLVFDGETYLVRYS